MKKVICLIAFLVIVSNLYSQKLMEYETNLDFYLQKSKNQNTTGWILLGTGTTMVVVGVIGFDKNFVIFGEGGNAQKADTYGYIMLAGLVMDIASIPFFISASKNKKRAARLGISNQIIYQPSNSLLILQKQSIPSLTVKLEF